MAKFHNFHPNCTLPNETPIGFVNGSNTRTTMQIVWSCLSVILLCTWSILHPNVPPELTPKGVWQKIYKKLFLLFRKVYWMVVMLIAPEFLTTFTTKKMLGMKKNWDLSHTILADMGGITIYFPNNEDEDALSESSSENRPSQEAPRSLEAIEAQPLDEKPALYEFIKTFMASQNRWLGGCGIPREPHEPHFPHAKKVQNIAALSGSVWTLDSKQLAIARQYGVIAKLPDIKPAEIDDKNKSEALVKLLAVIQVVWILSTVAFSATAIILYSIEWQKPKDVFCPVYVPAANSHVSVTAFKEIVEAAPFPYMQFPGLQCKHYYMPSVAFHETDGELKRIEAEAFVVALVMVVSFGGVHLFALNLQFPTPVEGLLWKFSAIMTIACPILYCRSHIPFMGSSPKHVPKGTAMLVKAVVGFTSFFYIFARLFLIVESIRSLYYLPQEAFISTWTANFPHIS
ncbi:hypothetical protein V8C37DRAFT_412311 [Trichoderma ceciliae]